MPCIDIHKLKKMRFLIIVFIVFKRRYIIELKNGILKD